MRFTFGSNCAVALLGELGDGRRPRRVDPDKPDPRARAEMAAFDSLAPEARAAIANSRYGAMVDTMLRNIIRCGAKPAVRERLKAKGLMPCDAGNDGVLLEELAMLDEAESDRIRRELVQ